ncbi:hypothetical protein EON68_04120, partial [archaeon]
MRTRSVRWHSAAAATVAAAVLLLAGAVVPPPVNVEVTSSTVGYGFVTGRVDVSWTPPATASAIQSYNVTVAPLNYTFPMTSPARVPWDGFLFVRARTRAYQRMYHGWA